jgi:hypothetical protein
VAAGSRREHRRRDEVRRRAEAADESTLANFSCESRRGW